MRSFRSYALNNHCPSTIYFSSLSNLAEKISSLRYPKRFGSLSVSYGSFWNPNTFHTIICISFDMTSTFHMTILITIMTDNFIVNRCTIYKSSVYNTFVSNLAYNLVLLYQTHIFFLVKHVIQHFLPICKF